eukprot:404071-Pyramimonas_sp.AAC.1
MGLGPRATFSHAQPCKCFARISIILSCSEQSDQPSIACAVTNSVNPPPPTNIFETQTRTQPHAQLRTHPYARALTRTHAYTHTRTHNH